MTEGFPRYLTASAERIRTYVFFAERYLERNVMKNSNARTEKTGRSKTKKLVIAALFAALSLVVKPFELYILPVARFNFVGIPIIMAGVILGPVWGGAVGLVADLAGFLFLNKSGMAINPVVTFANVLLGIIPGLVFLKGKRLEGKAPKYNVLNVLIYFVLLVLVAALLIFTGSMTLKSGSLYVISPSTGEYSYVSWVIVGLIVAAFAVYSVGVIAMVTGKGKSDAQKGILPKLLFAVTFAMIIGDIIVSGIGLGLQYGWPLSLMLVVRIIKSFFAIPVYTLVSWVIYKAVDRFKI